MASRFQKGPLGRSIPADEAMQKEQTMIIGKTTAR